ncbi:hypothetical protein F5Y13DRAFT_197532 [Hypoxylon sp. FL1857]|nr:hypothetical protein F5Y13DRAFT_197532 [Hypoxylon sp. FL1857]
MEQPKKFTMVAKYPGSRSKLAALVNGVQRDEAPKPAQLPASPESPEMPDVSIAVAFGLVNWESGATVQQDPPLSPRSVYTSGSSRIRMTVPKQAHHSNPSPSEYLVPGELALLADEASGPSTLGEASPSAPAQARPSGLSSGPLSAPVGLGQHTQNPQNPQKTRKRKGARNYAGSSKKARPAQTRYLLRSATRNPALLSSSSSPETAPTRGTKKSEAGNKRA